MLSGGLGASGAVGAPLSGAGAWGAELTVDESGGRGASSAKTTAGPTWKEIRNVIMNSVCIFKIVFFIV